MIKLWPLSVNPLACLPPFAPSMDGPIRENDNSPAFRTSVLSHVFGVLESLGRHLNGVYEDLTGLRKRVGSQANYLPKYVN